jgi:hypothetical protein
MEGRTTSADSTSPHAVRMSCLSSGVLVYNDYRVSMSDQDSAQRLIYYKTRRLQILREQAAIGGIYADPSIFIEIEKLEAELSKLKGEGLPAPEASARPTPPPVDQDSGQPTQPAPPKHELAQPASEPTRVPEGRVNPWRSGSFYVFAFLLGFAAYVLVRALRLNGYDIIAAVGVGITALLVIGILQLRNDNRLSDSSFTTLVIELLKRFPFFRKSP